MASRRLEDLSHDTYMVIVKFEEALHDAGLDFRRSCTYRSQEEQNALYMRGRFPLSAVNAAYEAVGLAPITTEENRRPVTWRRVSKHTGRTAVDYFQMVEGKASYGLKVDVDHDRVPDWMEFGAVAEACGLEWGGRWSPPDYAHVELSAATLRRMFQATVNSQPDMR